MVSALDSGSRGPGSRPGRGHVLCSWARHLSLTEPLSTQVYKMILVLGVTLRWTRNRDKLGPDGPLGSYADFTFFEKNLICFWKIFIAKLHNILSFPDDKILQKTSVISTRCFVRYIKLQSPHTYQNRNTTKKMPKISRNIRIFSLDRKNNILLSVRRVLIP